MKTRRYFTIDKVTLRLEKQCKTKPKYITRASFKKDNEEQKTIYKGLSLKTSSHQHKGEKIM